MKKNNIMQYQPFRFIGAAFYYISCIALFPFVLAEMHRIEKRMREEREYANSKR